MARAADCGRHLSAPTSSHLSTRTMLAHSFTPLLRPCSSLFPRIHSSSFPASSELRRYGQNGQRRRSSVAMVVSGDSSQVAVTAPTTTTSEEEEREDKEGLGSVSAGADVVRRFYSIVNDRNLDAVVDLIAEDCVYEDLVFPKPFVGRKAILKFFDEFMNTISKDLQFAIDDVSEEDTAAVGVTWHLEWKGRPFPFSKGCSFYRLDVIDGKRQIVYGRDVVEPFIKPGDAALTAIRGVTWLLERFPQLADRI